MSVWQARRELFFRILGVGALFSGVALVTYIIAGVSLRLGLVLTGGCLIIAVGSVWRRTPVEERPRIVRRTSVGLLSGLMATTAYDLTKFAFSQWYPSSYNPFEAIRVFGVLLVGPSMSKFAVYGAGMAFHVLNGVSFGLAFCFLFARPGVVTGLVWGFFLEVFQLTLFPGWLDIRFYREFAQISVLSHVMYGTVLGLSCKHGLRLLRL